jgi:hypothetical protein
MLEGTILGLLLTGTLLHLTVNCSPKGVTAPSCVGADLLGRSQTQMMGGGQNAFDGIDPFCCWVGRTLGSVAHIPCGAPHPVCPDLLLSPC